MRIRLLWHGVGAGKYQSLPYNMLQGAGISQSLPYNMLQGPAIVVAKAQIWRLAGAGRRYSLSLVDGSQPTTSWLGNNLIINLIKVKMSCIDNFGFA